MDKFTVVFYTIMAFVRPILFIVAVIGFTILMIKVARNNHKRRQDAINQLADIITKDTSVSNNSVLNNIRPKASEPVSSTTIAMCEQRFGISFPDELKVLYTFTNGLELNWGTLTFDFFETIEKYYGEKHRSFIYERSW